ncbi:fungal-specific transcription factor domain-containing protein [Xylariaceae sp. FL0804]|nr:fungal-specific transcription factor domain-containing protein [Xylariaceae sp. FL0804]
MQAADARPSKRQKLLACKRCRHRKQKCTEDRPCENCIQSGSECIPSEAATSKHPFESNYVRSLEERVAELETLVPQESLDHLEASHPQRRQSSAHRTEAQVRENQGPAKETYAHVLVSLRPAHLTTPRSDHTAENPKAGPELEQTLTKTYFEMANSQYPVLLKREFRQWLESWRADGEALPTSVKWKGFFVYMVFAIGFLMSKSRINGSDRSQELYNHAVSKYLPYLNLATSALARIQGFLLLTIYALHTPSRDSIIALSSWTMRLCTMAQLHLAETEPAASSGDALIETQHRRRVFWSVYAIDRAVCSSFDLPCSIADSYITVPKFCNIDDEQLDAAASSWHPGAQLIGSSTPCGVSSALHIIRSRQIESGVQEMMLRKDFVSDSDAAFSWRAGVLTELKAWHGRSKRISEPSRRGYVSFQWLEMIYYYQVIMLYRPDMTIVQGMSGELLVQACCRALVLFRRFQMAKEIAQPWLGLLTQFQIGVTLLYCFFATPPSQWKRSYKSPDVQNAVRACSGTLAILAERWDEVECARDVFEILAGEIPLSETWERPTRISSDGKAGIEKHWARLSELVVHRPTMRMIREMITDDFAKPAPSSPSGDGASNAPAATLQQPPVARDGLMQMHWPNASQRSSPQNNMGAPFDLMPNLDVFPDDMGFSMDFGTNMAGPEPSLAGMTSDSRGGFHGGEDDQLDPRLC